jgi:predicted ester cyclase
MLAEEDKVAYRYTFRATQSGSWRAAVPTGKPITLLAICIDSLTDGKIAEEWHISDALGLVQQLGMIPTPDQAS